MQSEVKQPWSIRLLALLLSERDRETIPGDLLEEMHARVLESGPLRARHWYARQWLSFVPAALLAAFAQAPLLVSLCSFTAVCALWLGIMDLRLQHPGYLGQMLIAALILGQGMLTLTALIVPGSILRQLARLGTVGILWLAVKAWLGVLHSAHMEGYILLIALALVAQAICTLFAMPRRRAHSSAH